MRALALMPLLLLLPACGLETNSPSTSDSTSGPETYGNLTISSTNLDFGQVDAGTSAEATLTLSNEGVDPIELLDASTDNAVFEVMDAASLLPITIQAGGSASLDVSFTPDRAVDFEGVMTLITDEVEASEVTVGLYGSAAEGGGDDTGPQVTGGELSLSVSSVDFGEVEVGEIGTAPLTVTNIGDEDVLIVNFTGSDTKWGYGGELALPYVLGAGQSRDVTLTVIPSAETVQTGSVTVVSDANNDEINIPTTVTGVDLCDICVPVLGYSPGEISLGLGTTSATVAVSNDTDLGDLVIDGVTIDGGLGGCPQISTTVSGFSGKKTLAPGDLHNLTVSYSNTTGEVCAADSRTLSITSNGGNASIAVTFLLAF